MMVKEKKKRFNLLHNQMVYSHDQRNIKKTLGDERTVNGICKFTQVSTKL